MGVQALKDIAFAGIIILKAGGFMTNIEKNFNELEFSFTYLNNICMMYIMYDYPK